ncbi:MAG: BlaI/MecI/CopY family transcriptional regulator [bacterium]|nr:BlaI/MecI/CopY family transcriptional regulator [bacterium]
MKKPGFLNLSRRERQIMDIIFRLGEASVYDVLKHLSDPPGYNSIRVTLNILENKRHLTHRKEGQRYIYIPLELPDKAGRSALQHLVSTFFDNSTSNVLSTLLDISASDLSDNELEELSKMIEEAKKEKQK